MGKGSCANVSLAQKKAAVKAYPDPDGRYPVPWLVGAASVAVSVNGLLEGDGPVM